MNVQTAFLWWIGLLQADKFRYRNEHVRAAQVQVHDCWAVVYNWQIFSEDEATTYVKSLVYGAGLTKNAGAETQSDMRYMSQDPFQYDPDVCTTRQATLSVCHSRSDRKIFESKTEVQAAIGDFRVEFAVGLIQPDELHDEGELGHPALTHYQRRQRQRRQSKMQTEEMFVECEQSEEEEEEIVEECRRSKFQCSEGGECRPFRKLDAEALSSILPRASVLVEQSLLEKFPQELERLANAKPTVNAPKSISQVSQMKVLLQAGKWASAGEAGRCGAVRSWYGVKEVPYCMMFLGGQQVYAKRIHGLRMAPRDAAAAKPKVLLVEENPAIQLKLERILCPARADMQNQDGSSFDYFTWQPPSSKMQVSNFAQRLQGRRRTFWTKNGPDGVELEEGHRLSINAGVDGKKRHVSLSDAEGNVLVSMSGEVVLDVDEDTAKNLAVEVRNTEINAFGSFSWRFVRLAMLIQLVWQVSKLYLSIAFEQDATVGKVPWARNLLSSLSWSLTGQIVCTEMWCYSLTGEAATVATHVVANLSSTAGIMLVSYFQFSEFFLCFVGVSFSASCAISGLATAPGFQYFNTMDRHPERRWKPRDAEGLGPLVGDQIYVAAPCLIFSAHGFAEACRLAATLAGAINSGGFAWVPTTCLGIALNLSARLGWSRFALMQITKKLRGGPAAMAIFAPTGWSKFHDELKIYCGYYRFVLVLALCAVRAIIYRSFSAVDAPLAPAFNLSATILIPVLLTAEFIEDHIVTNELLPINPAGPGLLKINAAGDNADPCQLITLEHLPSVAENDPWKMMELQTASRRSKMNFDMSNCEGPPQKTVSLSFSETYVWLSFIGIVAEFTAGLLGLLVGAGYMRGLCPAPLEGMERILGLVTWSVPLPC
ncbi:Uncharacterized protein SCF082_LOCUS19055 [Durusdinium trenchii]|uniref:Uncharacterized protein n=1 Tax=Durusdinium trenchii TaxID=1381693 RepID=A0ABP0KT17_9DINO